MDILAQNPYRILGVFANSTTKKRTANTAKIMAFLKVNKRANFKSDVQDLLGEVQRDNIAVSQAEALLSEKLNACVFALFWFHENDDGIVEFGALTPHTSQRFIYQQINSSSYAGLINAAILSLANEDFDDAVKFYSNFFDDRSYWEGFRDALGISEEEIPTTDILCQFIEELTQAYPSVDFWPMFLRSCANDSALKCIKKAFETIAIRETGRFIDNHQTSYARDTLQWLENIRQFKKSCLKHIQAIQPLEGVTITPSGQIALDKIASKLLDECRKFYQVGKMENENCVIPTMQLVKYAISICANSEILEDGKELEKELSEDIKKLPPREVQQQAAAIKTEIQHYCLKPDEIRWALALLKNCAPILTTIKTILGCGNQYYLSISTKVADNALYNCRVEVEKSTKSFDFTSSSISEYRTLIQTLRRAWELILSLEKLDLLPSFVNGNLREAKKSVEQEIKKYHVNCSEIKVTLSVATEEEQLAQCTDYTALVEYCQNHPDSPLLGQAIQKKWEIEDNNFPANQSVKNLLDYKEKYPTSHKNAQVAKIIEEKLFGAQNGAISDYRRFLQLFHNHPKRLEAMHRIDLISFKGCSTMADYKEYLNSFPNGAYRKTANERIDDILFNACKTALDYNRYIINNPNGRHYQEATKRIEDLLYVKAIQTGDYSKYNEQYPNGRYTNELKSKEEKKFYSDCQARNDYKAYLKRYPKGQYSALAKDVLKKKRQKKLLGVLGVVMVVIIVNAIMVTGNTIRNTNSSHTASLQETAESISDDDMDELDMEEEIQTDEDETWEENSLSTDDQLYSDYYGSSGSDDNMYESDIDIIDEDAKWKDNSLSTGDKPYSAYFGKASTGENYILLKTSGTSDYVVIVRQASDGKYMNHVYVNGGDNATMYLPDGTFNVYFYSGRGWNPNKEIGSATGGFVYNESMQQDGPVEIVSAYLEYTLYPVRNGNLRLQSADEEDLFD